jgi:hypothetical protein
MERVETLLKKLNDLFANGASAEQLLLTVQMLQAELTTLQNKDSNRFGDISVTLLANNNEPQKVQKIILPEAEKVEEKTVEVLQIDEAEVEAELEEIKRNAEQIQQITAHNKPQIVFEPIENDILPPKPTQNIPQEINQTASAQSASINDKLKQSNLDLGDTLTEAPIRDLKKAIGVNDRFLYINELFRGDESMYERSIKTINSFSILPEAEYWIQRELKIKIGWDDKAEVVKQFNQLIKRRFL